MNELRSPSPRLSAGARLRSSAEQARCRSTTSDNCEQHWSVVSGRWRSRAVDRIWNRRVTSRRAPGFEGLDDDHPPAAARTSIPVLVYATIFGGIGLPARRGRAGYAEEPAGQCNVVGPVGIGEEPVVTDAMKSVGQDMDQEAADELVGVERHQLIASVALGPVILPFESDAREGEGDDPGVDNSSTVCVAGKVGEGGAGAYKKSLGIHDPFDLAQCGEEGLEGCRLGE